MLMLHSKAPKKMKSRSGFVILLQGNPVTWFSKGQPLTSRSTEEAEGIAANEGIRALCRITNLFLETGIHFTKPKVSRYSNEIL